MSPSKSTPKPAQKSAVKPQAASKSKPKLYIIHGWTYTVAPWERTVASLEKQGLEVEILHVPGLTSPSKKVWTIEDYVNWADRRIPNGSIALGHSNGGRILLNLCSQKPDKLKQLILLDAAGVYENSAKRDVARSISKYFGFLKKIPGLARIWHKLTGASDYNRAPENMKRTLSNMLDSDKQLKMSRVVVPTSILWGAADTVTPPHQAEIMHKCIKNSSLEIFPSWTHAPYISHPIELAKAIFRAYKNPPAITPVTEVTKASSVSASMALKKAAEPEVPSTAPISATLSLKKAAGPSAHNTASRSASLAVPAGKQKSIPPSKRQVASLGHSSVVEGMSAVDYEQAKISKTAPRRVISSASVPKVKNLEKVRRKIRRTKPKSPKRSKGGKR